MGWYPPHGQDPRGRELGRRRCLPSAPPPKGKASCVPQSQQGSPSQHKSQHQPICGQHSAGSITPASPVRGGGMALPGRDWGLGREGVLSPS